MLGARSWARATLAILRRPWLWTTAVAQVRVMAPPGWWRRWPPIPVPDPGYVRFRLQTQYGDPHHRPEPLDVVTYLGWCRSWRRGEQALG